MKIKLYLVYWITFIIVTACNNDDDYFQSHTITSGVVLKDFVYLASPQQPVALYHQVIYEEENWVVLLTAMGYEESDIEININFNSEQLLVALYHGATSSGTTVDMTAITEYEDAIKVTVENLHIGTTTDVAQPFEIVKIPKTNKPIVFQEL